MDRRPLRPFSRSKIGFSSLAAFADISSTTIQAISSSVACGNSVPALRIRGFQTAISCLSTDDGDGWIACGSHGPVFNRVGELLDGSRIVPQACGRGLRHLEKRAFVLDWRSGLGHASSSNCKRVQKNPNTGWKVRSSGCSAHATFEATRNQPNAQGEISASSAFASADRFGGNTRPCCTIHAAATFPCGDMAMIIGAQMREKSKGENAGLLSLSY